jgi:hypothetical protein
LDELREHRCSAVRQVLSEDDLTQRCQFVYLDTVQCHDELFGFAKGNCVGSSTSFASLAHAFSEIEGDAARGTSHLISQVAFTSRELGHNAPDCSVQLQCAPVGVQLMKFVPTSTLVWLSVRGPSVVTVTVTVTVTEFR